MTSDPQRTLRLEESRDVVSVSKHEILGEEAPLRPMRTTNTAVPHVHRIVEDGTEFRNVVSAYKRLLQHSIATGAITRNETKENFICV